MRTTLHRPITKAGKSKQGPPKTPATPAAAAAAAQAEGVPPAEEVAKLRKSLHGGDAATQNCAALVLKAAAIGALRNTHSRPRRVGL
jgi:hypothetical protein